MPPPVTSPAVDFAALYARLERAEAAWRDDEASEDLRARVLLERAQLVARARAREGERGEALEVMAFRVAGERYAVRALEMEQVLECRGLAPLPGAAPHLLGAMAARGLLIPVLDLRRLLGLEGGGLSDLAWVLVVRGDEGPFGLAAELMDGPEAVPVEDLRPADSGPFHHLTVNRLAVLDLGRLVASATPAKDGAR